MGSGFVLTVAAVILCAPSPPVVAASDRQEAELLSSLAALESHVRGKSTLR